MKLNKNCYDKDGTLRTPSGTAESAIDKIYIDMLQQGYDYCTRLDAYMCKTYQSHTYRSKTHERFCKRIEALTSSDNDIVFFKSTKDFVTYEALIKDNKIYGYNKEIYIK